MTQKVEWRCGKCQRPLVSSEGGRVYVFVRVLWSTGVDAPIRVRCRHSDCKHEQSLPFALIPLCR